MAVKKEKWIGKRLGRYFLLKMIREANSSSTVMLRLDEIEPNRDQPRKRI